MTQALVATNFEPYGFLLRPRRSPCSTPADFLASAESASGCNTPPNGPASPGVMSREATPHRLVDNSPIGQSEHGKYLAEKLEFIVPPQLNPVERDTPVNARCLFVGHLRFETTTAELRWIIQRLTGVTALKAEVRGHGCFVVHLATEVDEAKVRQLNRRLLFDHTGVWYARTEESLRYLLHYIENVLPRSGGARRRALRLPRDSIVVEDTRRANNNNNNNHGGSPSMRPAMPPTANNNNNVHHHGRSAGQASARISPPTYQLSLAGSGFPQQGAASLPSEPSTPQGFHGCSLPDYVLGGDLYTAPPPPPYNPNLVSPSMW